MKQKITIISLAVISILAIIIEVILLCKNTKRTKSDIEIIDATYNCTKALELFYENDEYEYYFPCVKSTSIYVKFENGNKMLVVDALEQNKVTIDELIKAGLEVVKEKK